MAQPPALDLITGSAPYPGYRLLHFLGKGAWGEVWKVVRIKDGKNLAIKFMACDSQLATSHGSWTRPHGDSRKT